MAELGRDDERGEMVPGPGAITRVSPGKEKAPVERTSLGCARCGKCCEQSTLSVSWHEVLNWPEGELNEDITFIRKHWSVNPDFDEGDTYTCDMLDRETKLCTAHDERPPVCRDYPWYGDPPELRSKRIGPQCSYLLDVAPELRPEGSRPLIPLMITNT